uniref:Uncharacterized protein n=1 Tax=Anopheles culicifacies TaxID=139723 RepID=A0A182MAC5_9DIPT
MPVSLKKVSSALSLPAGSGFTGISKTSPTTVSSLLSSGYSSSMITLAGSLQQSTCQRQATSLQALLEGRILATSRTVASLGLDSASVVHGKSAPKSDGERRRHHHQPTVPDHAPSTTAQLAALALGTMDSGGGSSNQQPSSSHHHHGGASSNVQITNESGNNTASTVPSSSSFIEYIG